MEPESRNGLYVSIKAGGLDVETLAESLVEDSIIPGAGDEDKIRRLCADLDLSFADFLRPVAEIKREEIEAVP